MISAYIGEDFWISSNTWVVLDVEAPKQSSRDQKDVLEAHCDQHVSTMTADDGCWTHNGCQGKSVANVSVGITLPLNEKLTRRPQPYELGQKRSFDHLHSDSRSSDDQIDRESS